MSNNNPLASANVGAIPPPPSPGAKQSIQHCTVSGTMQKDPGEHTTNSGGKDNPHDHDHKGQEQGGGGGGGPKRSAEEMMKVDEISSHSPNKRENSNQNNGNQDTKRVKTNDTDNNDTNHLTNTKPTNKDMTKSSLPPIQQQNQQQQQQPAIVEDITYPSRGNMIPSSGNPNEVKRWRAHRMAEDYIQLSSQMMMPGIHLAPFGYDATTGHFPVESITALSILLSPIRRPTVIEKWSPYEIAVFEASLAVVGKEFHQVQKFVKTKSTKEIIEFYYIWKKTAHYKVWKRQYILPEDDVDSDDD